MSPFSQVVSVALLLTIAAEFRVPVLAMEPEKGDSLRRERLELLESRLAELSIQPDEKGAKPLVRDKGPILRWSNPVRDFVNDGITYLWLDGERPMAVVTAWARSPEGSLQSGTLFRELVSLSDKPLTASQGKDVIWTPRGGAPGRAVPKTDPPHAKPARRLVQMRTIARRFEAVTYKTEAATQLRLLPQPLYRYHEKSADVLDGALFAFTEGNDAEALLLLEAMGEGEKATWRYALARMTSIRVLIRLDGEEVFSASSYWENPRAATDLYVEAKDISFSLPSSKSNP